MIFKHLLADRTRRVAGKGGNELRRTSAVPFTQEAVRKYLDICIVSWREKRDSGGEDTKMAGYYVDAYQSVRVSLFGEVLGDDCGE